MNSVRIGTQGRTWRDTGGSATRDREIHAHKDVYAYNNIVQVDEPVFRPVPAGLRMNDLARCAVVFGACALFALPSMTRAQVNPAADARALYDAAYDRWHSLPRPPYATYDQVLTITRNGRAQTRRSSVMLRTRDHICRIVGVPLDARDRVDPPTVTDRCFSTDSALTFLPQPREGSGPLPLDIATPAPVSASNEPRTIGHVSTRVRSYEITYVGDETINGVATVHLALRPYRDPSKHLARDVWIDRATKGVVRLHGVAAFTARLASVDFVADYTEDATAQTLRHVAGFAKAQLLFVRAGADFTFDLSNETYPATLPDSLFEKRRQKGGPS